MVDIDQIGELRGGSPRLLGIPRPVGATRLLGPQCAKEHADGQKRPAYVDQIVTDVHGLTVRGGTGLLSPVTGLPQQVDGHDEGGSEQRVGHHVDYDVRGEPWTLQRGHQGLVVYVRLQIL